MIDEMDGTELLQIRRAAGLTQAAFAEQLGLSATWVGQMERGAMPIGKRTALAARQLAGGSPAVPPQGQSIAKSIEGDMAVLLATEALRARLGSSLAGLAVRVVVPEFFDFRRQFGLAVELKDGKRHAVKAETIGLAFMALTEWVEFYLEGVGDVGREAAADRTGDRAEAVRDGG